MASCFIQTSAFEFPLADIEETAERNGLLSMEIEFSRRCNYRCPYCYVPRNPDLARELSRGEIKDLMRQAKALGARKIIILGGEPSIYPHLLEMIDFIRDRGMAVEMFTNGSGIDATMAEALAERAVAEGWGLYELTPERLSLEDVFVNITTTEEGEDAA